MHFNRRSIVFRTSAYAALGSLTICLLVFGYLVSWQRQNHERRVIEESEFYLGRLSSFFLGYFYGQRNWVYLEERQKALGQTPNVLYSYIVNNEGIIDVGILGTESPDIGKRQQDWEPVINDPYDLQALTEGKPRRYELNASQSLVNTFPEQVSLGDKIVVVTAPFRCFEYLGVCGYVRLGIHFSLLRNYMSSLRLGLAICAILLSGLVTLVVFLVLRRNLKPIRVLAEQMRDQAQSPEATPPLAPAREFEETRYFRESLRSFTQARARAARTEAELQVSRSLSDLARQVAHDIRSPLAALEIATANLRSLPEEQRLLLRGALSRITDIANQLLSGRGDSPVSPNSIDNRTLAASGSYLLGGLVEELITEKRLEFRSLLHLSIEAPASESSYGLFVRLQPQEFKRVLSNLINNAVEACVGVEAARVRIEAAASAGRVELKICDNGRGVPSEVLPRLTEKAFSYQKVGGNGLGLHHAKENVERWGGSLQITSAVGRGTEVTLNLPQADAPDWFVRELQTKSRSAIIVVDDDASIHQIWAARFPHSKILHFFSPAEFDAFAALSAETLQNALLLIDYEFVHSDQTGIDLIVRHGLSHNAVLVTTRFGESEVLAKISEHRLRVVPKGQAGFVPIHLASETPT